MFRALAKTAAHARPIRPTFQVAAVQARGYHEKVINHYERPRNVCPHSPVLTSWASDESDTYRSGPCPKTISTLEPVSLVPLREYITGCASVYEAWSADELVLPVTAAAMS